MRIATVSHGYSGTLLPLAHHLALKGHHVDCYFFCWHGATGMESLEYNRRVSALTMGITIPSDNTIYRYLDAKVRLRVMPLFNPSNQTNKWRHRIETTLNNIHLSILARRIANRHYDLVNVILYTPFDYFILNYLVGQGVKCCVTYHEVKTDLTCNSKIIDVVDNANRLNTPIIVHSEKTREDLLQLSDVSPDRIHLIHFGLFESYLQYGEGKAIDNITQGNYLLYLGFVKPYKGLKYLYEAVGMLDDIKDLRVVVAGGGYDPALDKMREDGRFTVINRFIDNDELVYLMLHCRGVVCPYIGASQSGLVQTAMVFDRPVVATLTGAFSEIITEGVNGHLAKPADSIDLANAIRRLYTHGQAYDFSLPKSLDWNEIVKSYESLI